MNRMKEFATGHPTGETPGIEPVKFDVLKAAINGTTPQTVLKLVEPKIELVAKSVRLPRDIVDFIDFQFTKEHRMKKQDAYTLAIEAYYRPLMKRTGNDD